ncbi:MULTISPECIES: suppressor of fused domain protein [Comamonas]|uniref:suppressor of fused domain protein n=1 Tax=Comamonas TaxID=283 RepID=UPI0012CC27A3|nr:MULTISPECIES: suppressor of fused domain protein [Comamonas]MEB5965160.1 suppressor of fused domain protein [Comamonas testosteroni]MPS94115.1 suppressor of fused domain protein [Comamonas sp.]
MNSRDTHDSRSHAKGEEGSQGWDAIDEALQTVYGDQQPAHFATLIKFRLGGDEPLDGVSVYRSEQGVPHWHYVSYGFSDLYGDLDDSYDIAPGKPSGYGFELSFRLVRGVAEQEAPSWPVNFLQNIARYVFRTGNVLAPGHWMTANGPIKADADTLLTEMGFVQDPELPAMHTPYGDLMFLQLVGLTSDELREVRRWNVQGALQSLQNYMPLWITDLARPSLHDLPEVQAAIDAGAAREGSKTGVLYNDVLGFSHRKRLLRSPQTVIRLGSLGVRDLKAMLPARLPHGRPLILAGDGSTLELVPAGESEGGMLDWHSDHELKLSLTPAQMQAWKKAVKGRDGEYTVPGLDGLVWQVKSSVVTDSQGRVTGRYEER